jgi:hypothetical protein
MRVPKRDKERSKRLTPKKPQPGILCSPQHLGMILASIAPQIEAAGSLDRAIRLELVSGFGPMDLARLNSVIPLSRGGALRHPDADKDWEAMVRASARNTGSDIEELRKACGDLAS